METTSEAGYENAFKCCAVVMAAASVAAMCISGHGKLLRFCCKRLKPKVVPEAQLESTDQH